MNVYNVHIALIRVGGQGRKQARVYASVWRLRNTLVGGKEERLALVRAAVCFGRVGADGTGHLFPVPVCQGCSKTENAEIHLKSSINVKTLFIYFVLFLFRL